MLTSYSQHSGLTRCSDLSSNPGKRLISVFVFVTLEKNFDENLFHLVISTRLKKDKRKTIKGFFRFDSISFFIILNFKPKHFKLLERLNSGKGRRLPEKQVWSCWQPAESRHREGNGHEDILIHSKKSFSILLFQNRFKKKMTPQFYAIFASDASTVFLTTFWQC